MIPKVSIVIPTYNRFNMLKNAIQSALDQTYGNIEIIICDDGSDDENVEEQDIWIAQTSIQHPKKITYIKSRGNSGFVQNVNRGLSRCSGKYIHLLFDDDYINPRFIDVAVAKLESDVDIAFVQLGAFNDMKESITPYHPRLCGKIHKYSYLYYLHPGYTGFVLWSISPCNYVFRNKKILMRTQLYDGFHERQLRRGSGYDILFILDHFGVGDQEYIYHVQEHLCTFNSHSYSCSVSFPDEVYTDSKNGIYEYFLQNPCFIDCEVEQYLSTELHVYQRDIVERSKLFIELIEKHNLSIYELKSVLYSHDTYNMPWSRLREVLDWEGSGYCNVRYQRLAREFWKCWRDIPTFSLLKYIKDENVPIQEVSKEKYMNYLVHKKFKLGNGTGIDLSTTTEEMQWKDMEINIINSDDYKKKYCATFKNIVEQYWKDFCDGNTKKIGLLFCSQNIKYIGLWKNSIFNIGNDEVKTTWKQLFVQFLLRPYSDDECRMHSNKTLEDFERNLYQCPEYAKINGIDKVDDDKLEILVDLRRKVWRYTTVPLSYTDLLYLQDCADIPKSSLQERVKERILATLEDADNNGYYHKLADFYKLNEVVGTSMRCALQISGHLRFYKKLFNSLDHIKSLVSLSVFLFIWTDSVGIRYKLFDSADMSNEIDRCIDLFDPKRVRVESNDDFLFSNVWSGGFEIIETEYCSYPTIKSQYYSIYQCNCLRVLEESEKGFKYDVVFKLRFDGEFDKDFDSRSLLNIYFKTNFSDVIFVSNENDHSHTGGYTGCYMCTKGYWTYDHIHKHFGEHTNDICDFVALSSSDIMTYYCELYLQLEELYQRLNPMYGDVIIKYGLKQKIEENKQNSALLSKYNGLYHHFIITPDLKEEYRMVAETPWYPEGILRIYLKDYMVVSNRYFRIKLVVK